MRAVRFHGLAEVMADRHRRPTATTDYQRQQTLCGHVHLSIIAVFAPLDAAGMQALNTDIQQASRPVADAILRPCPLFLGCRRAPPVRQPSKIGIPTYT